MTIDWNAALRPSLIAMGRANLTSILTPLFATKEQRESVQAKVAAMSDEDIEQVWANYAAADEHRCPECGREYEAEPRDPHLDRDR